MVKRNLVQAFVLMLGGCSLAGCYSWSPGAFPMQNMSRVPPPGTGTYATPGNYYNANPAATSQSMAPPVGGLKPISGTLPTTQWSAGGAVQPAQFQQFSSGAMGDTSPPVQDASYREFGPATTESNLGGYQEERFSGVTSAGFTDSATHGAGSATAGVVADPTLQWQTQP